MSKYIEQSKANDEIVRVLEHTDCKDEYIDRVLMAIENLPTIDIVRCKDCKWCIAEEGVCDKFGAVLFADEIENHFCGYGERIDNE